MSQPPPLPHHDPVSKYWVLVADGASARIFYRQPEGEVLSRPEGPSEFETWSFMPVADLQFHAEPITAYDLGHNAPTTVFQSNGDIRHMSAPHVDVRRKLKSDLARRMGNALNQAKRDRRFERLVLIAPPAWLGFLRPVLTRDVRDSVVIEISRDFAQLTPARLTERLRQILPARHLQ